jgi:hypothetical protein
MNLCEFKNVVALTKTHRVSNTTLYNTQRVISAKFKNPSPEFKNFLENYQDLGADTLEIITAKFAGGNVFLYINGKPVYLERQTFPVFSKTAEILKTLIEQPKIEQSGELGGRKIYSGQIIKEYFNKNIFNLQNIKETAQGMFDDITGRVNELLEFM